MRALLLITLLLATPPALAGKKPKRNAEPTPAAAEPAAASPAAAAPVAESVAIACPFVVGAEHVWQQKMQRDGQRSMQSTTEIRLQTVAADDAAFEFALRTRTVDVQSDDPLLNQLAELTNQQEIPYQVRYDRATSSATLLNADALSAQMVALTEALGADAAKRGMPPEAVAAMRAMLTNPEMLQAMGTKGILPLVQFSCSELTTGMIPYEASLPNPMGGAPLPAEGSVIVAPGADAIRVTNVEKVGADGLRAMVQGVIAKLGASLPPEALAAIDAAPASLTMTLSAELNPTSGALDRAVITRVTEMAGQSQREVTEITLQPATTGTAR